MRSRISTAAAAAVLKAELSYGPAAHEVEDPTVDYSEWSLAMCNSVQHSNQSYLFKQVGKEWFCHRRIAAKKWLTIAIFVEPCGLVRASRSHPGTDKWHLLQPVPGSCPMGRAPVIISRLTPCPGSSEHLPDRGRGEISRRLCTSRLHKLNPPKKNYALVLVLFVG